MAGVRQQASATAGGQRKRDPKQVDRALAQAARSQKTSMSADAKLARAKEQVKSMKAKARDAERNLKGAEREQWGEQATRDQAVRAALDAGASEMQVAKGTGLSVQKIRSIKKGGPFGRNNPRGGRKDT